MIKLQYIGKGTIKFQAGFKGGEEPEVSGSLKHGEEIEIPDVDSIVIDKEE